MSEAAPTFHPDTGTITGAEHLVISENPYIELLTNPRLYDSEWRALANVNFQLCVVVVKINRRELEVG